MTGELHGLEDRHPSKFQMFALAMVLLLIGAFTRLQADTGTCSGQMVALPFTDVMGNLFFCQIAELYFLGVTNGTSATTYSPGNGVTRDQMAAFLARTHDSALRRASRRTMLKQYWTTTPHYTIPAGSTMLGTTAVGDTPRFVDSDGADLWVSNNGSGSVSRVRASDGRLLETWSGAASAGGVLVAMGRILATGQTSPGRLYMIDPSQPAGLVTTVATTLGSGTLGVAFDGLQIWTANLESNNVSIITPGSPFSVNNLSDPAFNGPAGVLYDGANIWVTNNNGNTLVRLDGAEGVVQTVTVGNGPGFPVFDGTNIWVPNIFDSSVTVVRVSNGAVVATLTGNGLSLPVAAAFDGQRVLVTNLFGDTVSLWSAADMTPLASISTSTGSRPQGACSDGLNFWMTLSGSNRLARF